MLVETQMKVATMQWSADGRLLAIVGVPLVDGTSSLYVSEFNNMNRFILSYSFDISFLFSILIHVVVVVV